MNELERRGHLIADAMGKYRGNEPLIDAVRRMREQLERATQQLADAMTVAMKIANRRPVTDRAGESFYRSRQDAKELLERLK